MKEQLETIDVQMKEILKQKALLDSLDAQIVAKEKALSDALTADLKAAVTEFKQTNK